MHNHGNYIISLGNLCRWLAQQAEGLGVEIYPGFAAAEVLYDEAGRVKGVATGNMGVGKDGQPTAQFHARRRAPWPARPCSPRAAAARSPRPWFERFDLREGIDPQTYRHRHQGAVGGRSGQAPAGQDRPYRRLAADQRRPMAARSSITSRTTRWPSASSSASTTTIPGSAPSRSSSASRPIRRSGRSSRAAGASPMARGRSTRAASSRSRS